MALIDRARDVYFDRARERWKHKGFDTDITDILASDSSTRNWLSRDISKLPGSAQESISRKDTTVTLLRHSVSKVLKSD